MLRRVAALLLLIVALALLLAPALVATLAIIRGEPDVAVEVYWPVFLVPLGFLIFGVSSSLRRREASDRSRDRKSD